LSVDNINKVLLAFHLKVKHKYMITTIARIPLIFSYLSLIDDL